MLIKDYAIILNASLKERRLKFSHAAGIRLKTRCLFNLMKAIKLEKWVKSYRRWLILRYCIRHQLQMILLSHSCVSNVDVHSKKFRI